ncbi:hypothetical protein WJX82_003445 [Trebouxia sp. C0006]
MKAATFTKALPALAEVPFDIPHVQNLVVGAGPAGYAVVSNLLDAGSQPIAWVDPEFRSGRLASYLDVPSNTKVKMFKKFATTPSCMSKGAETAVEDFKDKDPEKGCQLAAAQSMVVRLSEALHQHHADKVKARRGVISSLALSNGIWDINQGLLTADRVFLATGSHPRDDQLYPGPTVVPLDDALIPSKLSGQVTPDDTVCVVGSSHSAILVLMNLLEMKNGPRVVNLHRSSLKYAKFRDDGTIILDNTGLKGSAAEWAREKVDTAGSANTSGPIDQDNERGTTCTVVGSNSFLEAVPLSTPQQKEHIASCQALLNSSTSWAWTKRMRVASYSVFRSAIYREAQAYRCTERVRK